jgi:formyltetrahydrofolate hydrolase
MRDSAVLLIDCPDRKGLVARVSSLLYERGANILHADQHRTTTWASSSCAWSGRSLLLLFLPQMEE